MSSSFPQVAEQVARRLADVFAANVSVFDEGGEAVATSGSVPPESCERTGRELRLPLHLNGFGGCIGVRFADGQAVPEVVLREFVELLQHDMALTELDRRDQDLRSTFVLGLLRGETVIDADVVRFGETLGMDLSRPRAVVLLDAAGYILGKNDGSLINDRLRVRSTIDTIVTFFRMPSDAVCAYIGNGEIAILKASTSRDLDPWAADTDEPQHPGSWSNLVALKRACAALIHRLDAHTGSRVTIGVGRYHGGGRALAESYSDARAALTLGKLTRGAGQVHCLDELGITALAAAGNRRTRIELASYLLSPLRREPELRQTIEVFFAANCDRHAAAAELGIHRNTLTYRLQKIASLTGLDPRRFDDAVQIRLSLALQQLDAAS